MKNKLCPACGSSSVRCKPPFYIFLERQYDLYGCGDCGVYFVWPQPDGETLSAMYGKDYFERDFHCGHSGHSAYEHHESSLPAWVAMTGLKPPSDILEIGCATGYQLKAFQNAGYRCAGIEISADASEFARKHYGLDVVTGTVENTDLADRLFDVIYLHDVFEHLTKPAEVLRKIKGWLKPQGFIVIVIPTQTNTMFSKTGMALYSLMNKRTRVMLPPYHVFEYRPGSIRNLLRREGFGHIRLIPSVMSPSEIALRGSFIQRVIKKIFHYPNYILTRLTGLWGDRLTVIVSR